MLDLKVRRHEIQANGLVMHVAEAGEGHPVVLCHGFPESWYSWRHQLVALAAAGFRAIAPDMRGYGGTEAPADVSAYSIFHLVGDMIGLLDALGIERASIVGHDWGAPVAWNAAMMRSDRFDAVAGLSVPFAPRGPVSGLEAARRRGWHSFYQLYFQTPGKAEAEFERDVEATMRRSMWTLSAGPAQIWSGSIGEEGALDALSEPAGPMNWLTEADLAFYAAAFRARGFRGPLNWYRNMDRNWALTAAFQGAVVRQPSCFLTGDRDPYLTVSKPIVDALPKILPDLRGCTIIPGAGHWLSQEAPEEVNRILIEFLTSVRS